jgi:hypothetical protein
LFEGSFGKSYLVGRWDKIEIFEIEFLYGKRKEYFCFGDGILKFGENFRKYIRQKILWKNEKKVIVI